MPGESRLKDQRNGFVKRGPAVISRHKYVPENSEADDLNGERGNQL
jgi:hypothetical protein